MAMIEWRRLKPVNTSRRTKAQIVCEKELELYPHLVYNPAQFPGNSRRHQEFCECGDCHTMILQGIMQAIKNTGDRDEYSFTDPFIKL